MFKRITQLVPLLLVMTSAQAAEPVKLPPGVSLEENPKDASATKIVLVVGSNFYKPGEHDYLAYGAVLSKLLAQNPGVAPVYAVDWPTKPETFENAKAVVFFFDGGDKHGALKEDRPRQVQQLLDRGVGFTQFHQGVDCPKDFGDRMRSWSGAAFEKGHSQRAHWVHEFKQFPDHAICRGVSPFKIDDGWLWKLKYVDSMKGITPLLRTENPKAKAKPKDENESTVAWAYERPGGGKSFSFTGGHLAASLSEPGYRKFLVNGILWSAGVEIPKEGAKVDFDAKELEKYLTPKPAPK